VINRTYFVPATDLNEAREIAYAVDAGRIKHVEHYLDEASAERVLSHLNRLSRSPRRIYPVIIEQRPTNDGRIPVAWPVDPVGEVAAVVVIFGMAWVAGLASLWEKFA
jgi:hypothetical protein